MKGTRNVTAAQTASGEVAQGVRSFFFLVTRVCAFFSKRRFVNLFSLLDRTTLLTLSTRKRTIANDRGSFHAFSEREFLSIHYLGFKSFNNYSKLLNYMSK